MDSLLQLEKKYKNEELCGEDFSYEEYLHLRFSKNGLIVNSRTDNFSNLLSELLVELIKPEVAENLYSLQLNGTDTGANGTNEWCLNELKNGYFPKLHEFHIHQCDSDFHNCHILSGDIYNEDNITAKILVNMPNLYSFKTPSAPGCDIFTFDNKIECMYVDIGYDKQDFLKNLANSSNFKKLRFLQYGQVDAALNESEYINFEELLHFAKSKTCKQLSLLTLKNIRLSNEEINYLRKIAQENRSDYLNVSFIGNNNWI
jgi:hypothetical protein